MGLRFDVAELQREITNFGFLARQLLDGPSRTVLNEFGRDLDHLLSRPDGHAVKWEISRDRPILTVCSQGDHEPDGRGQKNVMGQLSCLWIVSPIRSRKRKGLANQIELIGIASTELLIKDHVQDLASWTMEVASDGAPGVYFHTQLQGEGFPVPRLPAYPVTPLGALEFLLSELFRTRWRQIVSSGRQQAVMWNSIQSKRFEKVLKWVGTEVSTTSSPIVTLQNAVPDPDLFL